MEQETPGVADEGGREAWWRSWRQGWRQQTLSAVDRALCEYAERLTRTPSQVTQADIEGLRAHGLDDVAVHDAIQVIAYFNYINRIADAVHVDLEEDMEPYPDEGTGAGPTPNG